MTIEPNWPPEAAEFGMRIRGRFREQFSAAKSEPLRKDFPHNPEWNKSDVQLNASACNSVQHPNPHFEPTDFPRRMCMYHFRIPAAFICAHSD